MLIALALAITTAQAQADVDQKALDDCGRADAAMNAQYRVAMAAMRRIDGAVPPPDYNPGYAATLLASQRAWITYRDTSCVVEGYGFRGGSAESGARTACEARLTRARTIWLKAQTR